MIDLDLLGFFSDARHRAIHANGDEQV